MSFLKNLIGKAQKMQTYQNKKWNMQLVYPEGWQILWENEPDGGWEIVVGVTGAPSKSGRPVVTVRVLKHAVLNFGPAHVEVFAAGGPALARSPEEYNEGCKRELRQIFRDLQFISEKTGTLAGIPSATLLYRYPTKSGTIRETQINLFGTSVTYRFLCEAPEEQSASIEKYFDSLAANFKPFAG